MASIGNETLLVFHIIDEGPDDKVAKPGQDKDINQNAANTKAQGIPDKAFHSCHVLCRIHNDNTVLMIVKGRHHIAVTCPVLAKDSPIPL
ncbi:unknown [Acidaminococcus intestini CAG:325]|nr:unknown [Acidaminococcus intestini CAG:325]